MISTSCISNKTKESAFELKLIFCFG